MSTHRPCRGHDAITMATPAVRRDLRWPRSSIASGTMHTCAPCVHHVTWCTHGVHHATWCTHGGVHHMVHTWCAPCGAHMVCTVWCAPCVHHLHTHGVPSGLIPWYLGTCPKQYEICRWPLTWPRYRSKNRKRLKPISSLGFLDKITKLIIQVLHSDLQRVAMWRIFAISRDLELSVRSFKNWETGILPVSAFLSRL